MFSNETTFHNNGGLTNRHNCYYWFVENPRINEFRTNDHQHRCSFIVWCGILNGNLIGPYFFDGNVNSNRYLHFLRHELPNLLEDIDLQTRQRMWFQQDGAPAHRSRVIQRFLHCRFPCRWIRIRGYVEWCPRSPDLTSPDYLLWSFLKNMCTGFIIKVIRIV